jgi:Cu-processing system permease protein
MLTRILVIAANSYREAVRARVLHGLFAVALAATAYSLVVANLSMHEEARVIADIGAASISLFAVAAAIILGATSLQREIEHKTLYPILTRPVRRHEYLIGKYLGILTTLAVFVLLDGAAVLFLLALQAGATASKVGVAFGALVVVLVVALVRAKRTRVFVLIPWAVAAAVVAIVLAAPAADERRLVIASCTLTIAEVAIVAAIATLFSAFSSPYLTSAFTAGVFLVGRSADTLGNLPPRVFGEDVARVGRFLAKVFPNLHVYVPARSLLLGRLPDIPVWPYVGAAVAHAVCYSVLLICVGALVFRKRDFA